MKKLSFLLKSCAAVILSFLMIHCANAQKKEVRNVTGFTGVSLSIAADIYLSQANDYKFEIEGDADYLAEIETVVDGDVLKIKSRDHFHFSWNDKKVKIYISMPKVNLLTISGSGDILAQSAIKADDLKVKISGSGSVKIENLSVKNMELGISGSGDIDMAGADIAESASYTISGSGDIDNQGLQCKKVKISVSGSGDVKVWAVDELDARVSGSGDVYYKGRPVINSKSSGSGSLHHL